MSEPTPVHHVLFLCTGNSARSILAEALLNDRGLGRFRAYSAGSHPTGTVNPGALLQLKSAGIDTRGLRSKSWDEFAGPEAPEMDFVITVCDNAAGELCPVWPGHPATAHWGVEDPAHVEGTEIDRMKAFSEAYRILERRIGLLVALPIAEFDRAALRGHLDTIGQR